MNLIRLEWKLLWRQRSYVFTLGSFAVLCVIAAVLGLSQKRQHRNVERALEQERTQALQASFDLAHQTDAGLAHPGQFRDPRDVSNYVRVFLNAPVTMPEPTAGVLSSAEPNGDAWYYSLNLGPQSKVLTSVEYESPELARTGRMDLAFVVTLLLPLFLIAVGHAVWASDREDRTERLVGMGVRSRSTVYLLRLSLATFPLVLLTMATCVLAMAAAHGMADNATLLRPATLVSLLMLLYSCFWIAVIFATVRTRVVPFASLSRLLLCWILLCIVLPAVAHWSARTIAPVPSRGDLLNLSRANADFIGKNTTAIQQHYLLSHPGLSGPLSPGASALLIAEANDRFTRQQDAVVIAQREKQQKVLQAWAFVSPPLLLQNSLSELEGDALTQRLAFHGCALNSMEQLRDYFRPMLFAPPAPTAAATSLYSSYPVPHC